MTDTPLYEVEYRRSSTKDGLYAYALRAEARLAGDPPTDAVQDAGVFVYRRSTPMPDPFGRNDNTVDDVFFNVATPVDLVEIPYGEPDPSRGMPYYRSDTVDLWFRNESDMERAVRDIDNDIDGLALSLKELSLVDPSNDIFRPDEADAIISIETRTH